MANNTIKKTNLMRGTTPTPDDFGYIPTDGVIYYDGATAPNGWETTPNPSGGETIKSELLFYGRTESDDGSTNTNKALINRATYNDFSTYLYYDSGSKCLRVLKPFIAVIVPWVECESVGGSRPEMGLCLTGSYRFTEITAPNTQGAKGGLAYSGYQSNLYVVKLTATQQISFQKSVDRGWAIGHMKIYKLFGFLNNSDMANLTGTFGTLSGTVNPETAEIKEQ